MGLINAIRRSYRYFLPNVLLNPKRTINSLFPYVLIAILGWSFGAMQYSSHADKGGIVQNQQIAMWTLLILKFWASQKRVEDSPTPVSNETK